MGWSVIQAIPSHTHLLDVLAYLSLSISSDSYQPQIVIFLLPNRHRM